MKKILLVGVLALFGAVNAQKTSFGIKGGYINSQINTKENMDFEQVALDKKGRSDFFIGLFFEQKFNEKIAVQIEGLYAGLGGKYQGQLSESGSYAKLNMDFGYEQIVFPISLKYYVIPELSVYAGPNISITTSSKIKGEYKESNLPADVINEANQEMASELHQFNKVLNDNLAKPTFGVQFGVDYTFMNAFVVDARYNLGVSKIYKKEVDSSLKLNYFQVGVGYKF